MNPFCTTKGDNLRKGCYSLADCTTRNRGQFLLLLLRIYFLESVSVSVSLSSIIDFWGAVPLCMSYIHHYGFCVSCTYLLSLWLRRMNKIVFKPEDFVVVVTLQYWRADSRPLKYLTNVFIQRAEADQVFFIFSFTAVVAAIRIVTQKQFVKCGIIQ